MVLLSLSKSTEASRGYVGGGRPHQNAECRISISSAAQIKGVHPPSQRPDLPVICLNIGQRRGNGWVVNFTTKPERQKEAQALLFWMCCVSFRINKILCTTLYRPAHAIKTIHESQHTTQPQSASYSPAS